MIEHKDFGLLPVPINFLTNLKTHACLMFSLKTAKNS